MVAKTAKLGFSRSPIGSGATLPALPLSSLFSEGGIVSCICVVIQRRFQLQFMETLQSVVDDSSVELANKRRFRDPRSEEMIGREYEKKCQLVFDKVFNEFSNPVKNRKKRFQPTAAYLCSLGIDGEALWNAVCEAIDPSAAQSELSIVQREALTRYKEANVQELLARSTPKRNVTPLLRVRVAGLNHSDIERNFVLPLTIWNPSEELLSAMKEGEAFQLYNLQVSTTRLTDPFAPPICPTYPVNSLCLPPAGRITSLSAGRSTIFRLLQKDLPVRFSNASAAIKKPLLPRRTIGDLVSQAYQPRKTLSVAEVVKLSMNKFNKNSAIREVDFSAIVVGLQSAPSPAQITFSHNFDLVYLCDMSELDDEVMLVLRVWNGLAHFSLESVLRPGNRVYFTDVQLRYRSSDFLDLELTHGHSKSRIVHLTYTVASYVTVEGPSTRCTSRQRVLIQPNSEFAIRMIEHMKAHYDRSFPSMGAIVSTNKPHGSLYKTVDYFSESPSSTLTPQLTPVRGLSSLLRGTVSAFSLTPDLKAGLALPKVTTASAVKSRTRAGLSKPKSFCNTSILKPTAIAKSFESCKMNPVPAPVTAICPKPSEEKSSFLTRFEGTDEQKIPSSPLESICDNSAENETSLTYNNQPLNFSTPIGRRRPLIDHNTPPKTSTPILQSRIQPCLHYYDPHSPSCSISEEGFQKLDALLSPGSSDNSLNLSIADVVKTRNRNTAKKIMSPSLYSSAPSKRHRSLKKSSPYQTSQPN